MKVCITSIGSIMPHSAERRLKKASEIIGSSKRRSILKIHSVLARAVKGPGPGRAEVSPYPTLTC